MKLKSLFFTLAIASVAQAASLSTDRELGKHAVDGINAIVDAIQAPYGKDELAAKFHIFGDDISKARVIFLGEHHFHEAGHLDQARALQFLLDPKRDVVLLEGGQAGTDGFCNQLVYRHFLLQVMGIMNDRLDKTGQPILPADPKIMDSLFQNYAPIFGEILPQLRINEPKVMNSKCLYWDDDASRGLDSISEGMAQRHEAMVREIKKHTSKGRRVFVIAGLGHLPNGDLSVFKNAFTPVEELSFFMTKDERAYYQSNRPSAQDMSSWYGLSRLEVANLSIQEFYSVVAALWRFGPGGRNRDAFGYGLSQGIYEFLKKENLAYTELVPKALIQALKPDREL